MLRRVAIGLALVLTFSVGIGVGRLALPALGGDGTTTPTPTSGTTDFGLIKEAWDTLHTKYVGADELNDQALIYGAINGMTEAVGDTGHTSFMTPEERAERSNDLSGKYVGIGVRIDAAEDGLPLIIGVFKGSPAEKAGIVDRRRDRRGRRQVDDRQGDRRDRRAGSAARPARSSASPSRAARTARRATSRMVRADVAVAPVSWTLVPGHEDRADPPRPVLARRRRRPQGRARRDPHGRRRPPPARPSRQPGRLRQRGRRGRQPVPQERHRVHRACADGNETRHDVAPGGLATDLPLVVLVDGGTASSSEIVSGALQDAGRAQIVGIKTYGTGTVLGEFPLSDGSALRVGTVEWLTPEGRRIWHEGITPDVVVERASDVAPIDPDEVAKMTAAEVGNLTDPQLARGLSLVTALTTSGG